ncbi:MAG TPA: c-type cytochrome domain-containing protein, partial [Planctomycetaceae bacterium]|nr:c-type cytochrome domain-containing protein [Planctomycetaceae bacterium]
MRWVIAIAGWSCACSAIDAAPPVSFEESIRPLLRAHCFACHGEDGMLEGKLDVRLVRHLQRGGDSGAAVVAGHRDQSPLYLRLKAGEMPP